MKKIILAAAASSLIVSGLAFAQGDTAAGKALFTEKAMPSCSMCHNADSTEKKMGPGLKGVSKRAKLNNGKKMSDAALKETILKGGGGMPAYEESLKAADVANLVAYLKSL
jgi:cytochrome c